MLYAWTDKIRAWTECVKSWIANYCVGEDSGHASALNGTHHAPSRPLPQLKQLPNRKTAASRPPFSQKQENASS
jgi:hypothetical protein